MTLTPHTGTYELATLDDRLRYAAALADAGMLPKDYRGQPANVLIAIEYGQALGIPAISVFTDLYVVNGRPSMSAKLMLVLARKAGHKIRIKSEAERAECTIIRADDPEDVTTAVWDKARAVQAGLWGKDTWKNYAPTMLKWRAVSDAVRTACPEVLAGLTYSTEELRDMRETELHDTSPEAAATAPTVTGAVVDPTPGRKEWAALNAAVEAVGLKGRPGDLRAFFARVIDRELASSKDMTGAEYQQIMAVLTTWAETGIDPTTGEVHTDPTSTDARNTPKDEVQA